MASVEAYWASLVAAPGVRRTPRRRSARVVALVSWVVVAALITAALATVGLRAAGWRPLTILSGSMVPTLQRGDMVLVTDIPATAARPGQVITFSDPLGRGVPITHRVVRVQRDSTVPPRWLAFTTRGDANAAPERWLIPADGRVARLRARLPRVGALLGPGERRGQLTIVATALAAGTMLWAIWRPRRGSPGR